MLSILLNFVCAKIQKSLYHDQEILVDTDTHALAYVADNNPNTAQKYFQYLERKPNNTALPKAWENKITKGHIKAYDNIDGLLSFDYIRDGLNMRIVLAGVGVNDIDRINKGLAFYYQRVKAQQDGKIIPISEQWEKDLAQLKADLARHKQEKTDLEAEAQSLEQQLRDKQSEADTLHQGIQDLNGQIRSAKNQHQGQTAEEELNQQDKANAQTAAKKKFAYIEKSIEKITQAIESNRVVAEKIQKQIEEDQARLASIQAQIEKHQASLEENKQQQEKSAGELARLQEELKKAEEEKKEIEKLVKQIDKALKSINTVSVGTAAPTTDVNAKLIAIAQEEKEIGEFTKQLEEKNKELDQIQQKIEQIQADIQTKKAAKQDKAGKLTEIMVAEKEGGITQVPEGLIRDFEKYDQRITERSKLQDDIKKIQPTLDQLNAARDQAHQELEQLEEELRTLQNQPNGQEEISRQKELVEKFKDNQQQVKEKLSLLDLLMYQADIGNGQMGDVNILPTSEESRSYFFLTTIDTKDIPKLTSASSIDALIQAIKDNMGKILPKYKFPNTVAEGDENNQEQKIAQDNQNRIVKFIQSVPKEIFEKALNSLNKTIWADKNDPTIAVEKNIINQIVKPGGFVNLIDKLKELITADINPIQQKVSEALRILETKTLVSDSELDQKIKDKIDEFNKDLEDIKTREEKIKSLQQMIDSKQIIQKKESAIGKTTENLKAIIQEDKAKLGLTDAQKELLTTFIDNNFTDDHIFKEKEYMAYGNAFFENSNPDAVLGIINIKVAGKNENIEALNKKIQRVHQAIDNTSTADTVIDANVRAEKLKKLREQNEKYKALKEQEESLEREKSALQGQIDTLEDKVRQLNEQSTTIQTDGQEILQKKLEKEKALIGKEASLANQKIPTEEAKFFGQIIQAQKTELEQDKEYNEKNIKFLEENIKKLQEHIKKENAQKQHLEENDQSLLDLINQHETLKNTYDARIQAQQTNKTELESDIQKIEQQKKKEEQEKTELQARLDDINASIEELKQKASVSASQRESEKAALNQKKTEAEKTLQTHKDNLSALEENLKKLKNKKISLEEKNNQTTAEFDRHELLKFASQEEYEQYKNAADDATKLGLFEKTQQKKNDYYQYFQDLEIREMEDELQQLEAQEKKDNEEIERLRQAYTQAEKDSSQEKMDEIKKELQKFGYSDKYNKVSYIHQKTEHPNAWRIQELKKKIAEKRK